MRRVAFVALVLVGFAGTECVMSQAPQESRRTAVEIDPAVFAPVLVPDGSLVSRGIRSEEAAAYFHVLDHVRRVDPELLKSAARRFLASRRDSSESRGIRQRSVEEFPVFVDLYNNVRRPRVYLGRSVILRGHLRKLVEMPAGENSRQITTLYEAWLFTSDSQQHPAVVITTSVPESLKREVQRLKSLNRPVLVNGVSVTGYFFKMYGYPARDAYRFAPLVLGAGLVWQPAASSSLETALPLALGLGLLVIGLPVSWFLWRNRRDDRQQRTRRRSEEPERLEWSQAPMVEDV